MLEEKKSLRGDSAALRKSPYILFWKKYNSLLFLQK